MTPVTLAALHAACFAVPRPWTAVEFTQLLADPHVFLLTDSGGFLLGRLAADEAEILTLAVDPGQRRQGQGRRLVLGFLETARMRGATRAFLEVSAENQAAAMLYQSCGFHPAGRRKGYFQDAAGKRLDALVLAHNLGA